MWSRLALAEEAYVGGRYGDTSYTRDDMERLIEVARESYHGGGACQAGLATISSI